MFSKTDTRKDNILFIDCVADNRSTVAAFSSASDPARCRYLLLPFINLIIIFILDFHLTLLFCFSPNIFYPIFLIYQLISILGTVSSNSPYIQPCTVSTKAGLWGRIAQRTNIRILKNKQTASDTENNPIQFNSLWHEKFSIVSLFRCRK